jgi:hypothetical protein
MSALISGGGGLEDLDGALLPDAESAAAFSGPRSAGLAVGFGYAKSHLMLR